MYLHHCDVIYNRQQAHLDANSCAVTYSVLLYDICFLLEPSCFLLALYILLLTTKTHCGVVADDTKIPQKPSTSVNYSQPEQQLL